MPTMNPVHVLLRRKCFHEFISLFVTETKILFTLNPTKWQHYEMFFRLTYALERKRLKEAWEMLIFLFGCWIFSRIFVAVYETKDCCERFENKRNTNWLPHQVVMVSGEYEILISVTVRCSRLRWCWQWVTCRRKMKKTHGKAHEVINYKMLTNFKWNLQLSVTYSDFRSFLSQNRKGCCNTETDTRMLQ